MKELTEIMTMPPADFMSKIVKHKMSSFVALVELMMSICVMKESKETIDICRRLVSKHFNAFLAANLISSGAR